MSRGKKMKSKMKPKTSNELDEFSAALELANAAQANAAKVRAKAAKAGGEAERAIYEAIRKGEALQERLKADKAHEDARAANAKFDELDWSIHSDIRDRRLLVTALGTLGSDDVDERAAAALIVEKQRAEIGKDWNDLIAWYPDDDDDEDLDDDELDDDDLDDEE